MTDRIEVKAALAVNDVGSITGVAWPFGSSDRLGDIIEPGAFKSASPPIPMLAYHQPDKPVGTWSALTVKSDGLHVAGNLLVDDVPLARELRALFAPYALPPPGRAVAGIEIDVEAGYGATASDVPEPLKQAIRQLVAHWYENRGAGAPGESALRMPATVAALIAPYRVLAL